jgi:hypothetical protein
MTSFIVVRYFDGVRAAHALTTGCVPAVTALAHFVESATRPADKPDFRKLAWRLGVAAGLGHLRRINGASAKSALDPIASEFRATQRTVNGAKTDILCYGDSASRSTAD